MIIIFVLIKDSHLELDFKANEGQVNITEDDVVLLYPCNGNIIKQITV